MVSIYIGVLLLISYSAEASPEPVVESEDSDLDFTDEAAQFLDDNGIQNFGDIILARKSQNVSECLHYPDTRTRVLQLCAVRTVYLQCRSNNDLFRFENCRGKRCLGRLKPEVSQCIFERLGDGIQPDTDEEGWICGVPSGAQGMFQWQAPLWARSIGGANNIGCLIALPPGGTLQNRVVCEGSRPLVEYSILFPSKEILARSKERIECFSKQSCGQQDLFSARLVCYESLKDNEEEDDLIVQAQDELENDDKNSSPMMSLSKSIICSLVLLMIIFNIF